ncbi:MAG: hypothetical protein Q4D12_10265 [Bacteroidales bacterium]|nr:hypothetical protein [Bacteroidales bacterium]
MEEFSTMDEREVTGEVFSPDLIIGTGIDGLDVVNGCLLLPYVNDYGYGAPFQFVDESSEVQTSQAGNFGGGPGELTCSFYAGKTEDGLRIYSFDFTKQQVIEFKSEKNRMDYEFSAEYRIRLSEDGYIQKVIRLANGKFVGMLWGGREQLFVLFDEELNEIKRFGEHPVPGMTGPLNDFNIFQGFLLTYGNTLLYCTKNFGYITRYDFSDDDEVIQSWKHHLSKPAVEADGGNMRIHGHENLDGFCGIATDGRYIYTTYSGVYTLAFREVDLYANVPRHILVFDWDGHLLSKCKVKEPSADLALSEDGKILYVYTYGEEEICITRYNTGDLL